MKSDIKFFALNFQMSTHDGGERRFISYFKWHKIWIFPKHARPIQTRCSGGQDDIVIASASAVRVTSWYGKSEPHINGPYSLRFKDFNFDAMHQ